MRLALKVIIALMLSQPSFAAIARVASSASGSQGLSSGGTFSTAVNVTTGNSLVVGTVVWRSGSAPNAPSLAKSSGTGTSGTGSVECTIAIEDDNHNPLPDAYVTIRTSNNYSTAPVASGKTDAFGIIQPKPLLDPGTYYIWRQKTGYSFNNPQTITVN